MIENKPSSFNEKFDPEFSQGMEQLWLLEDKLRSFQPQSPSLHLQHIVESIPYEWDPIGTSSIPSNTTSLKRKIKKQNILVSITISLLIVWGAIGWGLFSYTRFVDKKTSSSDPIILSSSSESTPNTQVGSNENKNEIPIHWTRVTTKMKEYGIVMQESRPMKKIEWEYVDILNIPDPVKGESHSIRRPGRQVILVNCEP